MYRYKRYLTLSLMILLNSFQVFLAYALDNGLAMTPPMGWNSWNIFHENINEDQIKEIADAMVSSGMKDAGYIYLNLDDNWMATSRDENGDLRADTTRFPGGMKALADYIHSKGLKFGIYGDRGLRTCHHYHAGPVGSGSGSYDREERDAKTFASWGVDYLKYDNCDAAPGSNMQKDYEKMRDALADCGRPIVFSVCAWGYQAWMPSTGNLWRTTGDITDKWDNGEEWFKGIINAIDGNAGYASFALPGGWNDPDMLEIGNGGCTNEEYRTQMSMWCIMASPLIAGNDIRNMSQATKDILLNKEAIAVNQDSAGIQGTRIKAVNGLEVWCKPLVSRDGKTKAVALLNRNATSADITVNFSDIGLSGTVYVRDLWAKSDKGGFTGSYTMNVASHGTGLLKLTDTPIDTQLTLNKIETEDFSSQSGIQIETHSEGESIGYIEDGDIAVYNNVDFGNGADGIQISAGCNSSGGIIEIRIDSITGPFAVSCQVKNTGGWHTYNVFEYPMQKIDGKHDLYFTFIGSDGYLFNVDWFTLVGGFEASHKISVFSKIEAENYSSQSGIQTESHSEGESIGFIENGDFAVYRNLYFGNGAEGFQISAGCNYDGGTIEIRIDSINGPLAGSCQVKNTGGWHTWTTFDCPIKVVAGKHDLFLMFTGSDGYLFNVDWFTFASGAVANQPQKTALKLHSYRTEISNGNIIFFPDNNRRKYSLGVYRMDGRLVVAKDNITGIEKIAVNNRGVFVINIRCENVNLEKRKVIFY